MPRPGVKGHPDFKPLSETHPEIAKEWDYEKNGDATPEDVSQGSNKAFYWKNNCSYNHSWYAMVRARVRGSNCIYCASKGILKGFNDLESQYPKVAAQWHPTKNTKSPAEVFAKSNKDAWWLCEVCAGEWKTKIFNRTVGARDGKGTGCPHCSNQKLLTGFNDLASKSPEVAAQWHPTLNGGLTPDKVVYCSFKRAYWLCDKCHHVWNTEICDRTRTIKILDRPTGCPECAVTGYKTSLPGYIYLVQNRKSNRQKVGITNYPKRRLNELKKDGYGEVLSLYECADGTLPPYLEKVLLQYVDKQLCGLGDGEKFDGYTESWDSNIFSVKSLDDLCIKILKHMYAEFKGDSGRLF